MKHIKKKRLSVTRTLAYYEKNKNEYDLITAKDIIKNKVDYKKKHLISNNLPIDENNNNNIERSNYFEKRKENDFFLQKVSVNLRKFKFN